MQTHPVVVAHIFCDNFLGILLAQQRAQTDRLALDALMPPFQFAVTLRVIRRCELFRYLVAVLTSYMQELFHYLVAILIKGN